MDFNKYDSVTAAETGGRLHIKDYVTGDPIMSDGKPCIVVVRGMESVSFQDTARAINAAKVAKGDTTNDDDKKMIKDVHDDLVSRVVPLIVGFENINRGDKPATADDAEWFLNLQVMGLCAPGKAPEFIMQVANFARDRANFLGNVSGG